MVQQKARVKVVELMQEAAPSLGSQVSLINDNYCAFSAKGSTFGPFVKTVTVTGRM